MTVRLVILFMCFLHSSCLARDESMALRCMLTCSHNNCAYITANFSWCLTHCVDFLSYSDLKCCAQAFFTKLRPLERTCAQQIQGKNKRSAELFCDIVERLFLKPDRTDQESDRTVLLMRALQEVPDLRDFVKQVGERHGA